MGTWFQTNTDRMTEQWAENEIENMLLSRWLMIRQCTWNGITYKTVHSVDYNRKAIKEKHYRMTAKTLYDNRPNLAWNARKVKSIVLHIIINRNQQPCRLDCPLIQGLLQRKEDNPRSYERLCPWWGQFECRSNAFRFVPENRVRSASTTGGQRSLPHSKKRVRGPHRDDP